MHQSTETLNDPFTQSSDSVPRKCYRFDAVFDASCSTRRVYDHVVHKIVQSSLNGINGTVLAAGSTNTGKTHTIIGDGGSLGLVTMALMDVFAARAQHESTRKYTTTATMVEIYNEQIIDLLADDSASSPVNLVVCSSTVGTPVTSLCQRLWPVHAHSYMLPGMQACSIWRQPD